MPKNQTCQKCGWTGKVKQDGTPYKHTRTKFRRDPDTDERQTVTVDCTGSKWETVEARDKRHKAAGWTYIESRDG